MRRFAKSAAYSVVVSVVVVSVVVATGAVGTVAAEEIVHFHNGTSMPILSHDTQDGMIFVVLGDDATLAFPEYMVERVSQADDSVSLPKIKRKNQPRATRAPGRSGGAVSSKGKADSSRRTGTIEVNEAGIAVQKPYARGAADNKRRLGATGTQAIRNAGPSTTRAGGVVGATRVGNRNVIGNTGPRGAKGRVPLTSVKRANGAPPARRPPGGGNKKD